VPKLPKVKVRKRTSERNINSMVLNMPTRYPVVKTDFTSVLSLIAAAVFFSSHLAGRSMIGVPLFNSPVTEMSINRVQSMP